MTITYAVPFKIGGEEFLADAFLDWSTAEGPDHKSELNWTSQYKWNVGISLLRLNFTSVLNILFGITNLVLTLINTMSAHWLNTTSKF